MFLVIGFTRDSPKKIWIVFANIGERYGMALHWDKFQLLNVRCSAEIRRSDGQRIEAKDSMTYLGITLWQDGKIGSELGRRIGMAWTDFSKLERLWEHTS